MYHVINGHIEMRNDFVYGEVDDFCCKKPWKLGIKDEDIEKQVMVNRKAEAETAALQQEPNTIGRGNTSLKTNAPNEGLLG